MGLVFYNETCHIFNSPLPSIDRDMKSRATPQDRPGYSSER
jgi:hypothetical protein